MTAGNGGSKFFVLCFVLAGHRVCIFSQFTGMLDILEDFVVMRGHDYARLDGSTNRVQLGC